MFLYSLFLQFNVMPISAIFSQLMFCNEIKNSFSKQLMSCNEITHAFTNSFNRFSGLSQKIITVISQANFKTLPTIGLTVTGPSINIELVSSEAITPGKKNAFLK